MATPPAGTPVAARAVATAALTAPSAVMRTPQPVVTQTPPPLVTRLAQMGATPTPPPVMRPPRARRPSAPQPPVSFEDDVGRVGPRTKFALAGLVLIAFSCGMMFMVAVDRFWPRPRAQCEGAAAQIASAPTSTKAAEAVREPAAVAPTFAETQAEPVASPLPVEPMPAARPLPAAKALPEPAPRVVRAPAPAPRVPAAAPAVVARGRATITARKRPASAGAAETLAPTESWNDPFAQ